MNREQAVALARKHAKAKPQSYFAEPFEPHEWVVDAILEAGFQGGLTGLAKAADVLWQDHVSRRHRMTLDEQQVLWMSLCAIINKQAADGGRGKPGSLVEAVRDMRQRWVALIQAHGWGDQFDGDIQNLDDAIAALSAEPLSHAWKSGYAQAKEEETAPSDTMRLDFLEMHGVEIGVSSKPEGSRFARWYRGQGYGDTIRVAIDTAMEQMEAEDSTKLTLLFSNDWLRERIASDPDDDPQAGPAVE